MRILRYFFATTLACIGISAVQAQSPGDDVTDQYMVNAGFEKGTDVASGYKNLGIQSAQGLGGFGPGRYQPGGWVLQTSWDKWNDAGVQTSTTSYEGSYIFNAWDQNLQYTNLYQTTAELPAGYYSISGALRMADATPSHITNQSVYAVVGTDSVAATMKQSDYGKDDAGNYKWVVLTTEFFVPTSQTVRVGASGSGDGTDASGWFNADGFKLVFLGNADEYSTYLKASINTLIEQIGNLTYDNSIAGGYQSKLASLCAAASVKLEDSNASSVDLKAIYNELKSTLAEMEASKDAMTKLKALDSEASDLRNAKPTYPGIDAFAAAEDAAYAYYDENSQVYATALKADLEKAIVDLTAAIKVYKLSQAQLATGGATVDFSWIITAPNLSNEAGTASDGTDWSTDNKVTASGGTDYKLTQVGGKYCWNSWAGSWTGTMDFYQDLKDLPAGKYTLSGLHTSNSAASSNAHFYATSSAVTAVSAVCSDIYEGSDFNTAAIWTSYTTDPILVTSDGKLRIGFTSAGEGTSAGWFCVTDFSLTYYGTDDALTEYQAALEAKKAAATKLAAEAILPIQSDSILAAVTAATNADASTIAAMETTLSALNEAIEAGTLATNKMAAFKAASYATLKSQVQDPNSSTALIDFVDARLTVVDAILASDTTTVAAYSGLENTLAACVTYGKASIAASPITETEGIGSTIMNAQDLYDAKASSADNVALVTYATELNSFVTFAKYYASVSTLASTFTSLAQSIVTKAQADAIATIGTDASKLSEATASLKAAVVLAQQNNITEGGDCTYWIQDSGFEATAGWSTGWTNSGFSSNKGQVTLELAALNGGFTGTYCAERWISGGSKLANSKISQVISGLPAGEYTLSVWAKAIQQHAPADTDAAGTINYNSPVTGVYLFANDQKVAVSTPVAADKSNVINGTTECASVQYSVDVMVDSNDLTIGYMTESTTANWTAYDNFSLVCKKLFPVGIEEVAADSTPLTAYAANGYIVVPGVTNYTVTTLAGQVVDAKSKLPAGIYIVNTAGKALKVAVK